MAFTRHHHVEVFAELAARRPPRFLRNDRRHESRHHRLRFFAAEATAHALADADDLAVLQTQNFGDDLLHFGCVLRRRMHRQVIAFTRYCERRLRLEIELFLPTDDECAIQTV